MPSPMKTPTCAVGSMPTARLLPHKEAAPVEMPPPVKTYTGAAGSLQSALRMSHQEAAPGETPSPVETHTGAAGWPSSALRFATEESCSSGDACTSEVAGTLGSLRYAFHLPHKEAAFLLW